MRERNGADDLRSGGLRDGGQEVAQRSRSIEGVVGERVRNTLLRRINTIEQRHARLDAAGSLNPGGSSTDQFPRAQKMYPGLFLRVRVLNKHQLRIRCNAGDIRELNIIIDPDAIMFEMEARVLEGAGEVDNGLANVLDLFLGRNLSFPSARLNAR